MKTLTNITLQNCLRIFHICLLIIVFTSCEKPILDPTPTEGNGNETTPSNGGSSTVTPDITEIGTPVGEVKSVSIGPAGGEAESADGKLKVIIPSGALSENLNISIQKITNKAPNGVDDAFRLLPHGQIFSQPVIIQYNYSETKIAGTNPDLTSIAFQDKNGAWFGAQNKKVDPNNKTIQVETNHFSDWAFFETFSIFSVTNSTFITRIPWGEKADFIITTTNDDLLVPDPQNNGYVPLASKPLPEGEIERWLLDGPGTIVSRGSKTTYFAPENGKEQQLATVSVRIKIRGQILILLSQVVVGEGLVFKINNGPLKLFSTHALGTPKAGITSFGASNSSNNRDLVFVNWQTRETVNDIWGTEFPNFMYQLPGEKQVYISVLATPGHPTPAKGHIYVRNYQSSKSTNYWNSDFLLENAGFYNFGSQQVMVGTAKIEGNFMVKR